MGTVFVHGRSTDAVLKDLTVARRRGIRSRHEQAVSVYLSTIEGADRAALDRVYAIALRVVPEAEEGTSYAMAALLYRGKGLIAAVQAKKFLSLYPFSGRVVAGNLDLLAHFETTSGSIHFSAENQLPDPVLRRIVMARRAEIDERVR